MKTSYNKSKIMRLANHYYKVEGYTRSQALKLAWSEAKRNNFYQVYEVEKVNTSSIMYDMNMLANTLTNYYANYRYNGD